MKRLRNKPLAFLIIFTLLVFGTFSSMATISYGEGQQTQLQQIDEVAEEEAIEEVTEEVTEEMLENEELNHNPEEGLVEELMIPLVFGPVWDKSSLSFTGQGGNCDEIWATV